MNYAEISVSERIKYAAEYCLILKDDPVKTVEGIIAELATTFFLTNEEASKAYLLSRKQFPEAYKQAGKAKAWHYTLIITSSLLIGIFYLLMSSEPGFGFSFILALLFFLGVFSFFSLIISNASENFLLRYPHITSLKKNYIIRLLPLTFLFSVGLFAQFLFGSIVKREDIVVKPLVLSSRIEKQKSGGKSPQYYYNFSALGYEKKFDFNQSDYLFADSLPEFKNYDPGDTVFVEVLKEDVKDLKNESFFSKNNRIIGMEINGNSIINYKSRRDRIIKSREEWLGFTTFAFVINLLLALYLINRKRNQYNQTSK